MRIRVYCLRALTCGWTGRRLFRNTVLRKRCRRCGSAVYGQAVGQP